MRECHLPGAAAHEIFVRQKNRRSATTPKNSIKAMRRMKSSPLIAEEKSCIQESTTLCGIFPKIQQAWSTVHETLFLWPFDKWYASICSMNVQCKSFVCNRCPSI
ncbi:unnamed protein product [Sphagnum balticum]